MSVPSAWWIAVRLSGGEEVGTAGAGRKPALPGKINAQCCLRVDVASCVTHVLL
jgi:hypothetical protein